MWSLDPSPSPGILIEMHIHEPHLRPTESETLKGDSLAICMLTNPLGDSGACSSWGTSDWANRGDGNIHR